MKISTLKEYLAKMIDYSEKSRRIRDKLKELEIEKENYWNHFREKNKIPTHIHDGDIEIWVKLMEAKDEN